MNVAQCLERAARHFPDRPAILFEGEAVTYGELERRVDRVAHALVDLGVSPGDRIALYLPNIPAFAVAYYAAQKVGAVAVSVNSMLTTEELRHVFSDSGAQTVFTVEAQLPALEPLLGELVPSERVVLCEGSAAGRLVLDELGVGQDAPFKARELDRDAPASILYTSGTTGRQKGATLSHGNVVSNSNSGGNVMGVETGDRLLLFVPLFHCFGQNAIMNTAFTAGATVVLHRRFVLDVVLDSIERDAVTMFFAVPTVYIALLDAEVSPERLASIRYYFSAASLMPSEVASRWEKLYGHKIYEGYGLTETSPFSCYNHSWQHRPGSVGTPIENVEMKIVTEHGGEAGVGEWGEIAIKGPNVMLGYWNRPEETANAIRDGWLHSGDIGYIDEDGYYVLVDRVKDMINAAGLKIWPREVEEVLYEHPAVLECGVVGVPDARKGEVAKAVIVLQAGAALTAEEVETYCRTRLAAYKVPRLVEFVDALPKSPTGKILKRVLRDAAKADTS